MSKKSHRRRPPPHVPSPHSAGRLPGTLVADPASHKPVVHVHRLQRARVRRARSCARPPISNSCANASTATPSPGSTSKDSETPRSSAGWDRSSACTPRRWKTCSTTTMRQGRTVRRTSVHRRPHARRWPQTGNRSARHLSGQAVPGHLPAHAGRSLRPDVSHPPGAQLLAKCRPDYLAYALLDAVVDSYFPVLEQFGEEIQTLEDSIIEDCHADIISNIHEIKGKLLAMRRAAWPHARCAARAHS